MFKKIKKNKKNLQYKILEILIVKRPTIARNIKTRRNRKRAYFQIKRLQSCLGMHRFYWKARIVFLLKNKNFKTKNSKSIFFNQNNQNEHQILDRIDEI